MLIHGRDKKTGRTLCRESVKRRWWVPAYTWWEPTAVGMVFHDPRSGINCKKCCKVLKRRATSPTKGG